MTGEMKPIFTRPMYTNICNIYKPEKLGPANNVRVLENNADTILCVTNGITVTSSLWCSRTFYSGIRFFDILIGSRINYRIWYAHPLERYCLSFIKRAKWRLYDNIVKILIVNRNWTCGNARDDVFEFIRYRLFFLNFWI